MDNKKKKQKRRSLLMKNKKGQMGMGLMVGLLTSVMVFIMMSSFLPVIVEMIGNGKGNTGANCVGYLDPYATTALGGGNNLSYNANYSTDRITCSVLNFTTGMYVLTIVFSIISGIITGKIAGSSQEQQYPQY